MKSSSSTAKIRVSSQSEAEVDGISEELGLIAYKKEYSKESKKYLIVTDE